jgi:hypothetical protein
LNFISFFSTFIGFERKFFEKREVAACRFSKGPVQIQEINPPIGRANWNCTASLKSF